VAPRAEVLARFQPVFDPAHLSALTEGEFHDFLLFENNHHWTGLQRQGPRMFADMACLRKALAILLDEGQPLVPRLDRAIGHGERHGKGGRYAVLLVHDPEKYGVWNTPPRKG